MFRETAREQLNTEEIAELKKEKPQQREKETSRVEDVAREKLPDVESENLSEEIRERVTERGIQAMREVLRGIPDYAVFASTAMYLHGKEKGIEEMQVLPGDFDGVVPDESTLKRIRERLANVPGVEFKNDGELRPIGNDSKYLKGDVVVRVDDQDVRYPFEFFTVSNRIIPKEVFAKQEKLAGLNVLSFEGLQNQYINNLAFESKVKRSAAEVAGYLLNETVAEKLKEEMEKSEDGEESPFLERVMEQYQLTEEQLKEFYEESSKIEERHEDEDDAGFDITPQMAKILSGYNVKIPKRLKNIGELKEAQRATI